MMGSRSQELWQVAVRRFSTRPLRNLDAPGSTVKGRFVPNHSSGSAMQRSEFDKLTAALGRAEFAVEDLQKKANKLRRKATLAKTMEEIAALNLEAAELLLQLRKLSDAVHAGNPAPHLRLVCDTERGAAVERRQPQPRTRLLKSGKILLGIDPIPCTIRDFSDTGACLQVQTTAGISRNI